jgi:hypothetical protein
VDGRKIFVKNEDIESEVARLLKKRMKNVPQTQEFLKSHIVEVKSVQELKNVVDVGGYAKMMWCANEPVKIRLKN